MIKKPKDMIERLIKLKQDYSDIMEKACYRDSNLNLSIKRAFEAFINQGQNIAMQLARHVDFLMRNQIRGMNEEQISTEFDQALEIFRLLTDKDEFENFYRAQLTKRLLNQLSFSEDSEKMMIVKLKSECGCNYTQKMEIMMRDIQVSKDLNEDFQREAQGEQEFGFNVMVLTTGNWSNDKAETSCDLPRQLESSIYHFTDFYMNKYRCVTNNVRSDTTERKFGRSLTWKLNFGHADMTAHFAKDYEIQVTGYMMCILLKFDDHREMTLGQIRQETQIQPEHELRRHLVSLLKRGILRKTDQPASFSPDDRIYVNEEFENRLLKFKVSLVTSKESASKETKQIVERMDEDRRHIVEATIVRIMKSRKTMEHNQLVSESITQLSRLFEPRPLLIKQRIETLIEKEYVKRDAKDKRLYHYIA